jgi:TPR repeat protein
MPNLARKRAYLQKLRSAATRGDTTAMLNLGEAHRRLAEPEPMFRWFRKAASQHDGEGLLETGHCYQFGVGTRKNLRAAERSYREAISNEWMSESGREEAMFFLATLLLSVGRGMPIEVPYLLRRANIDRDYPQAEALLNALGSDSWGSVCMCRRNQPRRLALSHCVVHNRALANNLFNPRRVAAARQ